jgi:transketolase
MRTADLAHKARQIRLLALEYTVAKRKGHLGGTYSCVDLLVALYYGGCLRVDPKRPDWADRDRFILSKGHACLAQYAILVDFGFIGRERLDTYGEDGGLGAQLDISIPGIDWNTGSLGHALGVGAGMALAARMDHRDYAAVVLLGDAEIAEGSIWEAIAFAADHRLSNLIAIVDRNRLSVTDVLEDDSIFRNFKTTIEGLGWNYVDVDGHDIPAVLSAFKRSRTGDRPTMMLANTIKGKGVSFMENTVKWHHSVPTSTELEIARRELGLYADAT